jgi:hypothetical protein
LKKAIAAQAVFIQRNLKRLHNKKNVMRIITKFTSPINNVPGKTFAGCRRPVPILAAFFVGLFFPANSNAQNSDLNQANKYYATDRKSGLNQTYNFPDCETQDNQPQENAREQTEFSDQSEQNQSFARRQSAFSIPDQCREKMETTPNFWQKDQRANFPDGGKEYCGPVAVSDSFIWFGKHGCTRLIPPAQDEYIAQEKLIRILASKVFMNTNPASGTTALEVVKGILKLPAKRGYRVTLKYQGINWKIPVQFRAGNVPDLEWICKHSLGTTGEILQIGWYKVSPNSTKYVREGGHFVTVVGYAQPRTAQNSLPALIVHNPGTGKQALLSIVQLTDGVLKPGKQKSIGLPRPAAGMYKIVHGLPTIDKKGSEETKAAIIEAAIAFRLD